VEKTVAWSFHLLRQQTDYEIVGLLTTFNQEADRVAMHAVRRSLVEEQARAIGIPVWGVDLPRPCSNADYECIMKETCKAAVQAGIECIVFGDLFLTDIREYREEQLKNSGLKPIFPLWGMPTRELAHSMIKSGVRAKLTCIDPKLLAPEFVGREFDEQLLSEFPSNKLSAWNVVRTCTRVYPKSVRRDHISPSCSKFGTAGR
jgi:diphthamide synthase (EF-2-diphthine--ammonia ligase)